MRKLPFMKMPPNEYAFVTDSIRKCRANQLPHESFFKIYLFPFLNRYQEDTPAMIALLESDRDEEKSGGDIKRTNDFLFSLSVCLSEENWKKIILARRIICRIKTNEPAGFFQNFTLEDWREMWKEINAPYPVPKVKVDEKFLPGDLAFLSVKPLMVHDE